MYRVINVNSREVLSLDELKTYSEAVHLAREAERHDSEPDVEVQVLNDGKWTRAENNQSIYIETIDRNGDLYSFSAEGFTVHLQEQEGGNFRVVRGIVASSPQDAIDKAKLWLGCCGFTSVKVYPGNDGWYATGECIYKESKAMATVVGHSPNGREIRQLDDGTYEVQPPNDNWWAKGKTVDEALEKAGWIKPPSILELDIKLNAIDETIGKFTEACELFSIAEIRDGQVPDPIVPSVWFDAAKALSKCRNLIYDELDRKESGL